MHSRPVYPLHLAAALLWLLATGPAGAITIDNGLAPPNSANVIDSIVAEPVLLRDSSASFPTTVELVDGGQVGGSAQERFEVFDSSNIIMSGGFVYDDIFAHGTSTVVMTGGVVGSCVCAFDSSAITISGGAVLGAGLNVFDPLSSITVIGQSFAVDGTPVALGLIAAGNGTLTGLYLSGEAFSVSFYHNGFDGGTYAGTIALVPEPSTASLLALGLVGIAAMRRRRSFPAFDSATWEGDSMSVRSFSLVLCALVTCTALSPADAGMIYAIDDHNGVSDRLVTIDPITFAVTEIGDLDPDLSFAVGGLAYDPNTDTLYYAEGYNTQGLYTVDRSTGAATLIGTHGIANLAGLAFDSANDVLYAGTRCCSADPTGFFELNTSTGAATLLGSSTDFSGLAYDSTRDQLGGMDGTDFYNDIDRANGDRGTVLSEFGPGLIQPFGLAYDPDLDRFWLGDSDGDLYSFGALGVGLTLHTSFGFNHRIDSMTYVVPEPTPVPSISFGGLGLLAGLFMGTALRLIRRQRLASA